MTTRTELERYCETFFTAKAATDKENKKLTLSCNTYELGPKTESRGPNK